MSKTILKKELSLLDRDQLIEVILAAYSSNKAIKDYFDFFSSPDPKSLYEKYHAALFKEISRSKRKKSTARISRIKKAIKDFESFSPGIELSLDLRISAIGCLIEQEKSKNYSTTLYNGTIRLLNETLSIADRYDMLADITAHISNILSDKTKVSGCFRDYLMSSMEIPGKHSAEKPAVKHIRR